MIFRGLFQDNSVNADDMNADINFALPSRKQVRTFLMIEILKSNIVLFGGVSLCSVFL